MGKNTGGCMTEKINSARDLKVYKTSFAAAMEIFKITKNFPDEDRYSLTDQIRRSSRSVCSNLAESWRKRRYPAVFCNKVIVAHLEASVTQTWLDFCLACEYINNVIFNRPTSFFKVVSQLSMFTTTQPLNSNNV